MEPEKYYTYFLVRKDSILNHKKTIFFALKAYKKYSLFQFIEILFLRIRGPPISINFKKIKLIGGKNYGCVPKKKKKQG